MNCTHYRVWCYCISLFKASRKCSLSSHKIISKAIVFLHLFLQIVCCCFFFMFKLSSKIKKSQSCTQNSGVVVCCLSSITSSCLARRDSAAALSGRWEVERWLYCSSRLQCCWASVWRLWSKREENYVRDKHCWHCLFIAAPPAR